MISVPLHHKIFNIIYRNKKKTFNFDAWIENEKHYAIDAISEFKMSSMRYVKAFVTIIAMAFIVKEAFFSLLKERHLTNIYSIIKTFMDTKT